MSPNCCILVGSLLFLFAIERALHVLCSKNISTKRTVAINTFRKYGKTMSARLEDPIQLNSPP